MNKPTKPVLTGQSVRLRQPQDGDAQERLMLGTDAEIALMFGVDPSEVRPLTQEKAEAWTRQISDNPYAWIVEAKGRLLGDIRLDRVHLPDRRASLAIGLYDRSRLSQGFGTEAMRLLLHYAFTELQLHRIALRVVSYNERAIRAYQKCGFRIEGREREAARVGNTWHDDIMMGLLAHEFQPN
ncbi:GNAT family N-acetyltransferase [Oryzifoliimicrobium ureilyticus]|uniref:GNAT family N-acetyltransferase n=1 Tax=Oryzifoliimicrobium ureilyticus TaxID=3113724 RepID=UPI003076465F